MTIGPLGSPTKSGFGEDGRLEDGLEETLSVDGVELVAEEEVGVTMAAVA